MSTVVTFGNLAPIQTKGGLNVDPDAQLDYTELDPLENNTTVMVFPEELDHMQIADNAETAWRYHSTQAPGWVMVESVAESHEAEVVEQILRERLGIPDSDPGPKMLLTTAGKDFVMKQMAGAASATAVAKWVALTANTTTPVVGDTTLTGEITTGGGGLVRAATTYAHTGGASTYTLTNTFTANGSDSLPVTIGKVGAFDAASSGTLVFSTLLTPTATLSASGDNLPLTWTVTI